MSKPYPTFCADCKHSVTENGSEWNLQCRHPKVNARNAYSLAAATKHRGVSCREERDKRWLSPCGMSGKLWEAK
jgi:hypothetical protein